MVEKYKNEVRTGRSNLWKQFMPIILNIKKDYIILIGSGECKVWDEPWCIPPLSKPPALSFTAGWCYRIRRIAGSVRAFVRRLRQSPRPRSTWNKIWLKKIPNRINAFLWKLRHGVVTVDSFLKAKNIPLASKCRCCEQPHEETINHLFAGSEVARRVWRALGLDSNTRARLDLRGIFEEWFDKANQKTRSGIERILLFSLGIWEIWKYRCVATFEEINNIPPIDCSVSPSLRRPANAFYRLAPQGATANMALLGGVVAIILKTPEGASASSFHSGQGF
uniref:Reverse transcriptase zinc-binding domain-containing protein n=1 Tax=Kalanchoe fedtschenkoi TaxID=63787 RepID=A0A7N0TLI1_KALFE